MKRLFAALLLAGLCFVRNARADSTVVFNEIMFHPVTNESALEWVELHNQMAVDMDLSAWFLTGGIQFTFPEGTIVPGGGYLVIASDPAALAASTGLKILLGPFTGQLNNSGELLELRDRNNRLMDSVDYGDDDKWPVAPDGSGASLIKRHPDVASASPENWTGSIVVGGTPGRRNFPDPLAPLKTNTLVTLDALWRFEASGTDLGQAWREPGFDDSSWLGKNNSKLISYWLFDGNADASRGSNGTLIGAVSAAMDRNGQADGALAFNGASQQYVQVAGGGGLSGATAGTISLWVKWTGTQDGDCGGSFGAILSRQGDGLFSDNIIALNNANPALAKVVWRQSGGPTPVLITGTTNAGNGVWRHVAVTFSPTGSVLYLDGRVQNTGLGKSLNANTSVPLSIGAWSGGGTGFSTSSIDDVAIWDSPLPPNQIAELAAKTKTPLDFANPERAVYFAGDGRVEGTTAPLQAQLPLGPTTYYFRKQFQFDGNPAQTNLTLSTVLDDGAVFYLNGIEVARQNLPAGPVGYSSLATTIVGAATFHRDIPLPATALRLGTNVLAVEVHQAELADLDMVFGAELTAGETPPDLNAFAEGGLVFNEVEDAGAGTFRLELFNRGEQTLSLGGFVVTRSRSPDPEYVVPPQTLAPGGFLALTQTQLGFGARSGDRLYLYKPGKTGVADAVVVESRNRGRSPDGTGAWLFPSAPTFGSSNRFVFRNEVVINEIMYHHRPTLEVPAIFQTNTLVAMTNLWKYEQSGNDLSNAWLQVNYDDSAWLAGPALLYVSPSSLPAPKNTALTLGQQTYYFRTRFDYTGVPAPLQLNLRHIVDDGAVFYLNGVEIHRSNIPAGAVAHATPASPSVGTAAYRGPFAISLTNLVVGTNVLAVEVHQAAVTGNDIVFGAELLTSMEVTPRVPFQESSQQWIELYNRSTNTVDLTGWRVDEGVDYRFAAGTMIPAKGYLVVAWDISAMQALYPGIAIVGPFTNQLSHSGERVALKDANNNPAAIVRYFDDGRWPEAADGGGPSLELRNPDADHSAGEAWAASDEGSKSAWHTYSYRGVAAASAVGPDGQWREFVLGLLDKGEVLLDDISVIETPSGTPVQLIQNGSFTTGATKWRILGNHSHGQLIDDPDIPGNKVLRLIATGQTEHMSNHAETTLANGRDTVNGREYEISFRAKWISGSRQLHTRLYFNRMARTTVLATPPLHGTPGKKNSTWAANLGPTYHAFQHQPPVPSAFEPVTVSVIASDPEGVATMTLYYSINGGAWSNTAMTDKGGGLYTAMIPDRPASSIIQLYVEGQDTLGATSTFPAAGPGSRALYKVDDGLAANNGLHNLRLILTPADAARLHDPLNLMSNERLGSTVIYDEREVFYDVGTRLKGSEHSRTTTLRLGFSVLFNADQLFRGVHGNVGIDRSESVFFGQREMLIHQTRNHAGGIPTKYSDLIQVITPRLEHTGGAELQLARYENIYLDSQYERGSDGMLFEYELIYQLNSTDNGTPEGIKVPNPDSVVGTSIRNLGDDKEAYRWDFLIKNNTERDDYSRLIEFAKVMGTSGTAFNSQIGNVIDVDQWLRSVAMCVLSGMGDNYGGDGSQHNVQFYVHPVTQKVLFFPHDVDAFFDISRPVVPGDDVTRIISVPANARRYYFHLHDIIATSYNASYLAYWASNYGRLLPAQPFARHLTEHVQRSNFILAEIQRGGRAPRVSFAITSNNGQDFVTNQTPALLRGNAWIDVKEIRLEGNPTPLALTWVTPTSWQVSMPLNLGTNSLSFLAFGYESNLLASDSISVTRIGSDSDSDGVPDLWELEHGLDFLVADGNRDPDGDGLDNLQEYTAGTDPTNGLSYLKVNQIIGGLGVTAIEFLAVSNKTYTVQWKESLTAGRWSKMADVGARNTNRMETTLDPYPQTRGRVYRLVTPQTPGSIPPGPVILTSPQSARVLLGDENYFDVFAVGAVPLSYQWRMNGNELQGATNSSLLLTNSQLNQGGNYTVVVTDAQGSNTNEPALLTVLEPPVITLQPQSQTVSVGETASFSVIATGQEPLRYRWRRNARFLANQTNAVLTLTNVQSTNAAAYAVAVSHLTPAGIVGVFSSNAVLTVTGGQ